MFISLILLLIVGLSVPILIGFRLILVGTKRKNYYQTFVGFLTAITGIIWFTASVQYASKQKSSVEENEDTAAVSATWGEKHLNADNLYEELCNQEVDYPEIVLSQALLETGHFESYSCRERNNLFGLRKRDGSYMTFPHWTYSVTAYKKYIQKYKEVPEDYYKYLDKLGYAEDSVYVERVRQLTKKRQKGK